MRRGESPGGGENNLHHFLLSRDLRQWEEGGRGSGGWRMRGRRVSDITEHEGGREGGQWLRTAERQDEEGGGSLFSPLGCLELSDIVVTENSSHHFVGSGSGEGVLDDHIPHMEQRVQMALDRHL
jgi:hypothetical protein